MAITIESLYYDFRSNYQDKWDYSIDFYTSNVLFFNNITSFKDVDTLKMYIQITCRYANALFNKSRFNECIDVCDKNLAVIDNEVLRLNVSEVKDDWYFSILFAEARSYYNLKDFKSSIPLFKSLMNYDPKNESYKSWLNHSKNRRLQKYTNVFSVCVFLIITIDIIWKNSIPHVIRQIISIIGLIGIITVIITTFYSYYMERSLRKKRT
jgi:tetratricopeptide (TPR) repeat protein